MLFTNLLTPSEVIALVTTNKLGYYRLIKNKYPELFSFVKTMHGSSLSEQLYNYCYPDEVRQCLHCGSNDLSYQEFTTGYKKYCSTRCVSLSDACRHGREELLNDPIRMKKRKDKAEKTNMERYGAVSWWARPDGRVWLDSHNKKIKERFNDTSGVGGRTRKQYTAACRHRTNLVYKEFGHIIDPDNIRSKEWVIDHIFSIRDGFSNNVPIDIICHHSNLKIISKTDNSSKNCRSNKTLEQLYEDFYSSS